MDVSWKSGQGSAYVDYKHWKVQRRLSVGLNDMTEKL